MGMIQAVPRSSEAAEFSEPGTWAGSPGPARRIPHKQRARIKIIRRRAGFSQGEYPPPGIWVFLIPSIIPIKTGYSLSLKELKGGMELDSLREAISNWKALKLIRDFTEWITSTFFTESSRYSLGISDSTFSTTAWTLVPIVHLPNHRWKF
jgi:hypothetical protein